MEKLYEREESLRLHGVGGGIQPPEHPSRAQPSSYPHRTYKANYLGCPSPMCHQITAMQNTPGWASRRTVQLSPSQPSKSGPI